jgi:hypothetical protein
VLFAGVDEQLGLAGAVGQLSGCVEVTFLGEERVLLHPVHLHRNPVRPGVAELRHGQARMEQQRAAHAGAGLGKLLRRHHAQGEPGVDQPVTPDLLRRVEPALQDRPEPGLLRVGDAGIEVVERVALVQVGDVDGVTSGAQFVRECLDARRQPLGVVKQHDLRHDPLLPNDVTVVA